MSYSTDRISTELVKEIKSALQGIQYGSVEIYIQDRRVTQITVRNIKKTKLNISNEVIENENGHSRRKSSLNSKIEVLTLRE